jgi:hypothetical protein
MSEQATEKTRAWGRITSRFGSRDWVAVDIGKGLCVKLTLDCLNHFGFKREDVRENASIELSYEYGSNGLIAIEIHLLDGIAATGRQSVKKQSHQNKRWKRKHKNVSAVVQ